jgi:hypothetical protein
LDEEEAQDALAKEGHLPPELRGMSADPEDGDPDDYELDGVEDLEQPCNVNQQGTVARAATRIALYMMREELGDPVLGEKQQSHAHDFFVVNSCKVYCKVKEPPFSGLCINSRQDTLKVRNSVSDNTASNLGHIKVGVNQSNTSNREWSGKGCGGSESGHVVEQCEKALSNTEALEGKQGEADISKQQEGMSSTNQNVISSPNNQTHKNKSVEAMNVDQMSQDEEDAVLHKAYHNQAKDIEGKYAMKRDNEPSQDLKCVSNHSESSQSELKHTDRNKDPPVASSSKDDEQHVRDILLPITRKEVTNILEEINR